jgi:hypothetical protein
MKRLIFFLLLGSSARAQTMPQVIDSVHAGYLEIMRIDPQHIAGLRQGALDIRLAGPNSLGSVTATVQLPEIPNAGSFLERKGNMLYAIAYGITPIDVSNPNAPVTGSFVALPGYTSDAQMLGSHLLVSNNNRVYFYSFDGAGTPVISDSMAGVISESKSYGNKLYAKRGYGSYAYSFTVLDQSPFLIPADSVYLGSAISSFDIANDQLLAKSTDTLYRFDLGGSADFDLVYAETMPGYPGNGRLVAIDTNYIGYSRYNSFFMSYGFTGNSFIDSFALGYTDYHVGSGRLDNSIYYGDTECTRLIGFDGMLGSDDHLSTDFIAFPNPVKDILNLQTAGSGSFNYILRDTGGKVITNGWFGGSGAIDVKELPAGIYLLHLEGRSGVETIVKQ